MPLHANTIRLFVSSTFGDFKNERNALHDHVFPRLRELCSRHGARFQAIDLRWGISAEAGLHQQTMQICLEEIERCQRLSLKPNFMVLLGDRFGWIPLPGAIPVYEFEALANKIQDQEQQELLRTWYRRDDNSLPPKMVLQPRRGEYAVRERWKVVEERLHRVITDASRRTTLTDEEARIKYEMSATGQEIVSGALTPEAPDASEHVFGFYRSIDNLAENIKNPGLSVFTDLTPGGQRDEDARKALAALKSRLQQQLPAKNILKYHCAWGDKGLTADHIEQFCADVYQQLSSVIGSQLSSQQEISASERETIEHDEFARERAEGFVGRIDTQEAISTYLESDVGVPLVIHGESGSGKSALMAHASRRAENRPGPVLIRRFIGVTPASSTSLGLLRSLLEQVNETYGETASLPTERKELLESIQTILGLATAEQPLFIFLDALDQLTVSGKFALADWLPTELPTHVHLVVSTTQGDTLQELERCVPDAYYYALTRLPLENGKQLLNAWLAGVGRCLTDEQAHQVLDSFAVNGLPLYLRLAFERARHWHSYQAPEELPDDVRGLIRVLIAELSEEKNHGELLVDRVFDYLAAARHGLTEDELLDLLSRDIDVLDDFQQRSYQAADELPVVVWSRLHGDLAPYLVERDADGARVLAFFHRQFMELAVEESLQNDEIPDRAKALADYFTQQPNFLDEKRSRPNARKLAELPYHLIRAESWQQLEDTLMDFDFCMAKCQLNESDDLVGYFMDSLRAISQPSDEFRLWEAFMRERAHILRRGDDRWPAHKILLQLAVEHADDSPVTIKAEAWLEKGYCDWRWLRNPQRVAHAVTDPCLHVFEGHMDDVSGALELRDGKILSWSRDNTLRLWSSEGQPLGKPLTGHTGIVSGAIELSNDRILSWSGDKTLRLWNSDGISLGEPLTGHTGRVSGAIELTNGRILSWSWDKTLRLWNSEGQPLGETLVGHTARVRGATVMPDGRILSWSSDNTMRFWSKEGKVLGKPLSGHSDLVDGVKVMSDGRILSWSADKTLRLWGSEGQPLGEPLSGHTDSIRGATELSDGRILSWSHDGTLRLWSSIGESPSVSLSGHTGYVGGVVQTLDGRILSWSGDKTLRLWNSEGQPLREPLSGHTDSIRGATVLSDGRILSWSGDKTLRLWSGEGQPLGKPLSGHTNSVGGATVLSNGRILSWSGDKTLRLWNSEGQPLGEPLSGHTDSIRGTTVLSNGRILSWSGEDALLRIWSRDGDSLGEPLLGHTGLILGAKVMPDGRILSWSADETLRFWTEDGKALGKPLSGHSHWIDGAKVMPDGRVLSWSRDETLRLWNSAGQSLGEALVGHTHHVRGATIMSNGLILSWSTDRSIRWWGSDGSPLYKAELNNGVSGVEILPNGQILSWSGDGVLRWWSVEGKPLRNVKLTYDAESLRDNPADEIDLRVMPNGRILTWFRNEFRSKDKVLRLFDINSGREIGNCLHEEAIYQYPDWLVAKDPNLVSPNGNYLACEDGNFCVLKTKEKKSNTFTKWHSSHGVKVHHVFDDGTTVVRLSSGDLFCLKSIENEYK